MKKVLHVGFTGTRRGMTHEQRSVVWQILCDLDGRYQYLFGHHGDCLGADAEFHEMLRQMEARIVIHPPTDPSQRAFCGGSLAIRDPRLYLNRNRDIVHESRVMIGAPKTQEEVVRSGTWATIRYARKIGVPLRIVFPDGRCRREDI